MGPSSTESPPNKWDPRALITAKALKDSEKSFANHRRFRREATLSETSPHETSQTAAPESDSSASVESLKQLVREFVDERNWSQYHSPKNLAMSLAIETAELMEHFQWLTTDESRDVRQRSEVLAEVEEELADVLCYALALSNELEIDISRAIRAKMQKNRAKYPADKFRGRYGHRDQRPSDGTSESPPTG